MSPISDPLHLLRVSFLELTAAQRWAFLAWAEAVVSPEEEISIPVNPKREVIERQRIGSVTYQLEGIKCGKERCKCARGQLHGPYYYGYRKEQGKLKSWYIGKELKLKEVSNDEVIEEIAS